eukprot:comp23310_c1_seq1/m.38303 comp23310_c1_seq1/g.38303  ORF comp23310_c1_seq1/g.38303 comp23310_c1_seq1/m.38303 type:complete len:887 (-) comp23310_c1_seq1:115-2775(-)
MSNLSGMDIAGDNMDVDPDDEATDAIRDLNLGPTDTDTLCLSYKDLSLYQELGRGAFGVVYAGSLYGSPVAIKMLHTNISNKEEFIHEINVMRRLRHPNIVLFLGATVQPDPLCIITELVGRGALMKIIEDQNEIIDRERILRYSLDIARGMNYLHHCGVIHLDLTPNNVLVTENYVCKVGDFGLSKVMSSAASVTNKGGGTVIYTAPEVYKGERIRTKVDVYSFAICLWQLYYRKLPYEDMHQHAICFNVVANNMRPELQPNNPPPYQDLMVRSWSLVPRDRPSFDMIIKELEALQGQVKKEDNAVASRRSSGAPKITTGVGGDRPKDVQDWTEEDVVNWAEERKLNWAAEIFQANDINGKVLLTLTDDDMKELGIKSFGWRRSLVLEINQLIDGPTKSSDLSAAVDSRSTVAMDKPEICLDDVEKFEKGHAFCKITPPENITCDRCEDHFYEFDRVYKCKSCNMVLHKECWSEDQDSCPFPVQPPTSTPSSPPSSGGRVPMSPEDSQDALFPKQGEAIRSVSFGGSPSSDKKLAAQQAANAPTRQRSVGKGLGTVGRKRTSSVGQTSDQKPSPYSPLTGSTLASGSIISTGGMMYTGPAITGASGMSPAGVPAHGQHGRRESAPSEQGGHKEDKEWKRYSNVMSSFLKRLVPENKEARGKQPQTSQQQHHVQAQTKQADKQRVKEKLEMILGQVLMAKKEGMTDFDNKRYEFSYMKFKAAAEGTRNLCVEMLQKSTGKPFQPFDNGTPGPAPRPGPPGAPPGLGPTGPMAWESLDRMFSDPANMPYRPTDSEEDNFVIFATMVRTKMEVALNESSMLVNPEYSFIERSNIIKDAFDFVLATAEIIPERAPHTPEPRRGSTNESSFTFRPAEEMFLPSNLKVDHF